ncbi:MAG: hypothetical protein IPH22_10685 [Nitrosomonas sp.]|nr:hypothetical protein [Nitrosomonas sp.]
MEQEVANTSCLLRANRAVIQAQLCGGLPLHEATVLIPLIKRLRRESCRPNGGCVKRETPK